MTMKTESWPLKLPSGTPDTWTDTQWSQVVAFLPEVAGWLERFGCDLRRAIQDWWHSSRMKELAGAIAAFGRSLMAYQQPLRLAAPHRHPWYQRVSRRSGRGPTRLNPQWHKRRRRLYGRRGGRKMRPLPAACWAEW